MAADDERFSASKKLLNFTTTGGPLCDTEGWPPPVHIEAIEQSIFELGKAQSTEAVRSS